MTRPGLKVAGLILAGASGGVAAYEMMVPLLSQSPPTAAPPLSRGPLTWVWSHQHGRHLTEVTVSTVTELTAAVGDSAVDKITVAPGRYEFDSGTEMCTESALCIDRAVIIKAELAGSVVLDAKGSTWTTRRYIEVQLGGAADLIELNITGGYHNSGGSGVRVEGVARLCVCTVVCA